VRFIVNSRAVGQSAVFIKWRFEWQ